MTGQQITEGTRIIHNRTGQQVTVEMLLDGVKAGRIEFFVEGKRGGLRAMSVGVDEVVATW